jgi:hypothetical protein
MSTTPWRNDSRPGLIVKSGEARIASGSAQELTTMSRSLATRVRG